MNCGLRISPSAGSASGVDHERNESELGPRLRPHAVVIQVECSRYDVGLIAPTTPEHGPVRRWIRGIGINSPILVETAHRLATIPLVLSGLGAALLARPVARQAVALGALACRLDPPIYRPAFLIDVPPPSSAAARAFLEIVEEVQASDPNARPGRHPTEGRPVERATGIGVTKLD